MNKVFLIAASVLLAGGCSNSNVNPEDVDSGSVTGGVVDGGGQPQFDDVPGAIVPPTTEDTDNILITPEAAGTLELTPARLLDVLNGNMIPQMDGFAERIATSGAATENPIAGTTFTETDTGQSPAVNRFDCNSGGKLSYNETDASSARTYILEDCVLDGITFNGTLIHTPGTEHRFSNFSAMQGSDVVVQVEGAYGETVSESGDSVEYTWNFPFYRNPDTDLSLRGSSMRETLSSTDGCNVMSEGCAASWELNVVLDLVTRWSNNKPLIGFGTWSSTDKGIYTQGIIEATTADGDSKITLDADNGDPATYSSVISVDGVTTSETLRWTGSGVTCRTNTAVNVQLQLCK